MVSMKKELKQEYLDNLNDHKISRDAQLNELRKTVEIRENRIQQLEKTLHSFVENKLNVD